MLLAAYRWPATEPAATAAAGVAPPRTMRLVSSHLHTLGLLTAAVLPTAAATGGEDGFSCVPAWRSGQGDAPDPFAPKTQQEAPQQRITSASHSWNVTLHGSADMDTTLTPCE